MPIIVPNKPINGAVEPTLPKKDTFDNNLSSKPVINLSLDACK